MKKTELILLGIAILALILKMLHISGSGVLTVLSVSSISVFYMYIGFALFNNVSFRNIFKKDSYKGISSKRIIGGIGTGLALGYTIIGILFKFQSWPNASNQLGMGLLGLGIVMLISLIKIKKSTDNYYSNILKRVVIIGALGVFLFAIPTKTLLNWKYPNNPEYVNAILEAQENPGNQDLRKKVKEEREKMYDELDNKSR